VAAARISASIWAVDLSASEMRTSWAALAGTATADTAAIAARIANFFMGRLQEFLKTNTGH
jgi:hypothetical protein